MAVYLSDNDPLRLLPRHSLRKVDFGLEISPWYTMCLEILSLIWIQIIVTIGGLHADVRATLYPFILVPRYVPVHLLKLQHTRVAVVDHTH